MPLMPGSLRRRGPTSDADIRRHSFLVGDPSAERVAGRASEQIPRRPTSSEFLAPSNVSTPALNETSINIIDGVDRPISPPIQDETPKHRRFSMFKFRYASDSQLSIKARQHADAAAAPPVPHPPEIITTAPTLDLGSSSPKKSKIKLSGRLKTLTDLKKPGIDEELKTVKKERRKTMTGKEPSGNGVRVTFEEVDHPSHQSRGPSPPAYGDEVGSTLAIPINRLSESSRSDGSGEHGVYATTTTTTHTVHTTTTFFRLTRRRRPGPLFPLPPKASSSDKGGSLASRNPPSLYSQPLSLDPATINVGNGVGSQPSSPSHIVPTKLPIESNGPRSSLVRNISDASSRSSPSRSQLGMYGRSSTLSSLKNTPSDDQLPTPTLPSTRTSTSTGRKSFGDLFGLPHRIRYSSEPSFPRGNSGPATPGSGNSKNNSVQLSREPIVIPERQAEETPAKYLMRLEEAVSRGVVASVLSKSTDQFLQQALRSYMRGFGFFGDPMDMAIRKLLMEVELPKETQQIDRCLQGFANRYHECNPGIYASPDQAYFIAFSLLILHTDVFNKNNKHKMQKSEYLKNTRGEGIFDEILDCFYDNICYTPFIHVEDDLDINGERIIQHKMKKKSIFPRTSSDPVKRPSKEPVDPYTLIIDSRLDMLRPNLKEVMHLDEPYNYLGTSQSLNLQDLQKTFFRTGVLQIVSARSRPDAFMSEKTATNPEDAHPGIVDIKITKVGLLWRKDAKKKKTRSPWQEWGAILTGSQLYFFRNTTWIKNLMHQLESHIKQGHDGIPVIFKPPLDQFKPDALMSTDDAVALMDSTYKKHKNAFLFIRHGGIDEVFLADNEDEMNDWMAKLNYAAAFRTSGVRMRGVVGGNYEGQRTRGIRRLDSNGGSRSVQTPTGEVTIISGKIDTKMAQDILAARREIMLQKIEQAEEKLAAAQKQLDDNLRNARHLQILAPIQAKTREQVLSAAAHMAAKLKWTRVEIWRMKCHRDILMMDLDEERKTEPALQVVEGSSLGRLDLKAINILTPHRSLRSTNSRPSTQPTSENDMTYGTEDVFTTSSLAGGTNFHKSQPSWELPPHGPDSRRGRHSSISNSIRRSPQLPHASSFPSVNSASAVESAHGAPTPHVDAEEQVLGEAGLIYSEPSSDGKGKDTCQSGQDSQDVKEWMESTEREKVDRGKIIRRSLHRTLREVHAPPHQRSRKGKESSSGAGVSDETHTDDALARGSGSFVVHGKKASVITFGEEFNNMSPEERLRLRKMSHRDESASIIFTAPEDGVLSTLPGPAESELHRDSAASTNTATARSFRELHKRLSTHAAIIGVTILDGDDSEAAVSFSDGRHTPLPPVEDLEEIEPSPSSGEKQATFYTPEAATTPTKIEFREGNGKRQCGPGGLTSLT